MKVLTVVVHRLLAVLMLDRERSALPIVWR